MSYRPMRPILPASDVRQRIHAAIRAAEPEITSRDLAAQSCGFWASEYDALLSEYRDAMKEIRRLEALYESFPSAFPYEAAWGV